GRSFGDRLETAVLAMMDGVQDCVMRELRIQWPFEADGAFAEPGARAGHDRLHLWFGRSEHDPAIRMDPIAFTEFCIGGSPARP
ncbi:MAG TPA: hypothetical protein VF665_17785, partial [Longimicrobium sp.]|uniref:hypothetical protein n=1 Tax=Longimicrobium sp. TaxID=2029185 RepID=UPI002ED901DF